MLTVNNKKLTGLLAGCVFYGLSASAAHAVMINEESPDAGELTTTAQDATGGLTLGSPGVSLDSISGSLINLGTAQDPVDDVDLFRILITDPAAFSVTVTASLSGNNDAMLYLLDSAGVQTLVDDDSDGLLPQFNPGALAASPAGEYFLALSLFLTNPDDVASTPPTLASGWYRDPLPSFQTGPYALALTGVETAPKEVPEPGTLALFGLALAGIGVARRRQKA